jgi:ABC-type phosphate transport system permease subunit
LIASGLVLFVITLVVNFGARSIVRRGARKAAA